MFQDPILMSVEGKRTDASSSSEDLLAPCISGSLQNLLSGATRGLDLMAEPQGFGEMRILDRVARRLSRLGLPCCGGGGPRCLRGLEDEECPPLLELSANDGTFEELYEVGPKLGEGSFGKVYACAPKRWCLAQQAKPDDMHLAVKETPTQGRHCSRQSKLGDDERAELVRLFTALDHPNIVRHRRFVETKDMLYIVMDRCEGPDLLGHVEECGKRWMSFEDVRTLASQILGAVAAVHALGMMHRDVKPENFRYKDQSATCLQLLDFGAAKPAAKEPAAHTVTGTLLFAAPEVFDSLYNSLCDVWSAGVVLFLLIAGNLPFETSDVTMLRSMHKDPVLTGDSLLRGPRWRKAPSEVRGFMRGLLAVDPATRVSAAGALEHPWLTGEDLDLNDRLELGRQVSGGSLRAVSRSASLADLKRSYFVWNLADCQDAEELPGDPDPTPEQQVVDEAAAALELVRGLPRERAESGSLEPMSGESEETMAEPVQSAADAEEALRYREIVFRGLPVDPALYRKVVFGAKAESGPCDRDGPVAAAAGPPACPP